QRHVGVEGDADVFEEEGLGGLGGEAAVAAEYVGFSAGERAKHAARFPPGFADDLGDVPLALLAPPSPFDERELEEPGSGGVALGPIDALLLAGVVAKDLSHFPFAELVVGPCVKWESLVVRSAPPLPGRHLRHCPRGQQFVRERVWPNG